MAKNILLSSQAFLRQQTKLKTNTMEQCPNKCWFREIFIFFQNYQNQGQSTGGKEKRRRET